MLGVWFRVGEQATRAKRSRTGRLAQCPGSDAGYATSLRVGHCALPQRNATQKRRRRNARRDSRCPRCVSGKLQDGARGPSAICMQRATPRGLCTSADLFHGVSTGSLPHRFAPTRTQPLDVGACVVCERPWALRPSCGEVKPFVDECFCLWFRPRNRWAGVSINNTKKRVFRC